MTELVCDVTVGREAAPLGDLSRNRSGRSLDYPEGQMPTVQCGNRLVLDITVGFSGLVMPMSVGSTTCAVLRQLGRLGPVIGHPQSRRQTILTCLPDGTEQTYRDSLLARNVSVAAPCIPAPMPGDQFREWIELPRNGFLLAMGEVVRAMLGVPRW